MKSIDSCQSVPTGDLLANSANFHFPADLPMIKAGMDSAFAGGCRNDLASLLRLVSSLTSGGAVLVVGC
jgi:hypothetical protein